MSEFAARLDAILDTSPNNVSVTDLIAWSREAQRLLTEPKTVEVFLDRKTYMREYMRKRRAKA